MGEGEMREILTIDPCGTSRVLLHAVKSYDMGPSRFTSHPRGSCAADIYLTDTHRAKKPRRIKVGDIRSRKKKVRNARKLFVVKSEEKMSLWGRRRG
jgi:hypothetical protein